MNKVFFKVVFLQAQNCAPCWTFFHAPCITLKCKQHKIMTICENRTWRHVCQRADLLSYSGALNCLSWSSSEDLLSCHRVGSFVRIIFNPRGRICFYCQSPPTVFSRLQPLHISCSSFWKQHVFRENNLSKSIFISLDDSKYLIFNHYLKVRDTQIISLVL